MAKGQRKEFQQLSEPNKKLKAELPILGKKFISGYLFAIFNCFFSCLSHFSVIFASCPILTRAYVCLYKGAHIDLDRKFNTLNIH